MKESNKSTCKAFVLDGVSFSYGDTNSLVLDNITLECQEGEWLVIIGRNGSGKSTLLKFINALLVPKRGVCHVFGLDTSIPLNVANVRKQVAMVFQNPESQIVGVTVEDDAAFALENQRLSTEEIERRVAFSLSKTGLLEKRKHSVHSLSGGEKQKLTLSGAIAQGASMFLLDEATSMLDSNGREDVLSLFMELHSEGHTVVQVTHNIEEVRFADRIVIIDNGRVTWSGGRHEFFSAAELLGFDLTNFAKFARSIGVEDITDFEETKRKALSISCNDERIVNIRNLFSYHTDSLYGTVEVGDPLSDAISCSCSKDVASPPRHYLPSVASRHPLSQAKGALGRIEVRGISHVYSDGVSEKVALDNISFCLNRGELVSVTGHTGSGKSTLIQYLNALYTISNPADGEVLLDGQNININPREARRKIGMVFQFPEHQLFAQTVREELSFALNNWEIPGNEHESRILETLLQVGIPASILDRNPFTLSGGEKRAVCIASALVTKPHWLVLDEPVAGLDSKFIRELLSLLNDLKSTGTGILIVTHCLEFALLNSDRIIVLQEGKLVCDAIPEVTAKYLHDSRVLRLPEIINLWREVNSVYNVQCTNYK